MDAASKVDEQLRRRRVERDQARMQLRHARAAERRLRLQIDRLEQVGAARLLRVKTAVRALREFVHSPCAAANFSAPLTLGVAQDALRAAESARDQLETQARAYTRSLSPHARANDSMAQTLLRETAKLKHSEEAARLEVRRQRDMAVQRARSECQRGVERRRAELKTALSAAAASAHAKLKAEEDRAVRRAEVGDALTELKNAHDRFDSVAAIDSDMRRKVAVLREAVASGVAAMRRAEVEEDEGKVRQAAQRAARALALAKSAAEVRCCDVSSPSP